MTRTTPRQWRVFTAQVVLASLAIPAVLYLIPSWWAILPLPAAMLLPALVGAGLDSWDEEKERNARWAHPSSGRIPVSRRQWDEYLEIPKRDI